MLGVKCLKKIAELAQRIFAGICLNDYYNTITTLNTVSLMLVVVVFSTVAVCALTIILGLLYSALTMITVINDVVKSPDVHLTVEKCFPGAVQKINRGIVSRSYSVLLDFGRRAIATLIVGTWGAVQVIGACMIVVVDLLGPSRRPDKRTPLVSVGESPTSNVPPHDVIERTRRIPLEHIQGDPILRAVYAQGWEDRTEDMHLNMEALNPTPTRPLSIVTPPVEQLFLAFEQTSCKITLEEKKLESTTTSAQIPAPLTRKEKKRKRDMARLTEFLAKKRGKAIEQTGPPPTTLQDTNVSELSELNHRPAVDKVSYTPCP